MAQPPATTSTSWTPLALRVVASIAVGLLAFFIAQAAANRTSGTSTITMILEDSEVSWPYHDAARQGALGNLTSSPEAAAIARNMAGDEAEIDGELLSGQSHFSFNVRSNDAADSETAVLALVDWAMAQNIAEQQKSFLDELSVLEGKQIELQDELDQFVGSAGTTDHDTLEAARYLENTSLLAQYERQADEVQTELDLVRPQFRAVGAPKEPVTLLTPVATALAAALAALAAFVLFEPRKQP